MSGQALGHGVDLPPQSVHYDERFLVRSYQVDPSLRLGLVWLNRILQEVAWQHASRLGWGLIDRDGGSYWVLARLRMLVHALPAWGEEITVSTFPVGTDRLLANREFVVHRGGVGLVAVHTGWLIVDSATRRPVRPQRPLAGVPVASPRYPGATDRLPDFPADAAVSTSGPHAVRYHDVDQYRHVNNSAYLEWMLDSLGLAFLASHQPSEVQVDYLQETLPDDEYLVRWVHSGLATELQVSRERDDAPTCRARILWRRA